MTNIMKFIDRSSRDTLTAGFSNWILFILSCFSVHAIKPGIYKYQTTGRIEFGVRYIFQGVAGFHCTVKQLVINPDSTFVYDFNTVIYKGT
jgi:hypothetical protein